MVNIVPYDPMKHKEDYIELNTELIQWYSDQLNEKYNLDSVARIGQTVEEYVDNHIESLTSLKPPEGVIYIVELDEEVVGTGSIKKIRGSLGEIKRMYIRSEYRGNGFSRLLINKLLETGKMFGCSSFILETPRFSIAAHGLYRSVGFVECDPYPECEVPSFWTQYWMYMKKN